MKRMIHFNKQYLWGNTDLSLGAIPEDSKERIEVVPRVPFQPTKIYSNAPRDGGAFYITYRHKNGTVDRLDLSVAGGTTQPIDWPPLEKGEPLIFELEYTGFIPRGYICGSRFQLTFTIEGDECP